MRFRISIFFLLFACISVGSFFLLLSKEEMKTEYIWVDHFSENEKEKIETWLSGITNGIDQTFSSYPFIIKYYIHDAGKSEEAVPWANTSRKGEQAVHFYIDTRFPLKDFQLDWTAAHEISHLSLPFLGRSNLWFSEGYASYWQWRVLEQQGIYSEKEIKAKYQSKLDIIKPYFNNDESFLSTIEMLLSDHNYPAIYWGGACYFFQADSLLISKNKPSLKEVITEYQNNGRLTDNTIEDLIQSLDNISDSKIFSELFFSFQTGSAKEIVYPTQIPDAFY